MIREKAIAELESTRMDLITAETSGWMSEKEKRYVNACDMAIEALEQEPCENAISRQAVLDMMQMRIGGKELYKAIYNLPPVTPQSKTGRWIHILEDWNKWECSECGFTKRTDVHVDIGYKYCPNCGCCMESEVENADSD